MLFKPMLRLFFGLIISNVFEEVDCFERQIVSFAVK